MEAKDIPLYSELVKEYKNGNLKPKNEDTAWLIYFSGEERKKLGIRYATYCPFKEFVKLVKFNEDIVQRKFVLLFEKLK